MNRILRNAVLAVLAGLLVTVVVTGPTPVQGQTAISSTTLSAAVARTATSVALTSDAGVSAGTLLYVDGELMQALSEQGTSARWNVRRGLGDGMTPAAAHPSGGRVWVGASGAAGESFHTYSVTSGSACSTTDHPYRPFINTKTGQVFECEGGVWMQWRDDAVAVRDFTVREAFDTGYIVAENDATGLLIKSVTDTDDNVVMGSLVGLISYREEQTKTTASWVIADGVLDISADDTTTNEGVEIVFGGDGANTTEGLLLAGTSGGCVAASVTVADISGTDQVQVGWRQNEAWQDGAAYTGYTVWNTVGINATDGSIVSSQEVSEATDTDDSGVNWADGETRALKVCVSKAGVPTAFYSSAYTHSQALIDRVLSWTAIPMTETGSTLTAGLQLLPFVSYLAEGTDGPDVTINWVEITRLP